MYYMIYYTGEWAYYILFDMGECMSYMIYDEGGRDVLHDIFYMGMFVQYDILYGRRDVL